MVHSEPLSPEPIERKRNGSVSVAAIVESTVGCKWSVRLLQLCAGGDTRPSAFLRACPGLSAKVMNERLRKLVGFGIVRRTVFGAKPPVQVEYRLTPFGRRFLKILAEIRRLQDAVDSEAISKTGRAESGAPRTGRLGRR
jgi:DNA-binding HxlR family transcriptional regulator